jgi:hypothetical protein
MIKRVLVLLLATATLCGGLYVLRAGKPRKLSPTPDIGLGIESDVAPLAPHEPPPRILTPHIIGLIVAAVLLGTAAYLGLGDSTGVSAVTPPSPSAAAAVQTAALEPDVSASPDELQLIGSNSRSATAKTAGAAAPSPAPPGAELQPPARTARSAVYALIQTPTDGFEAMICSKPWPCAEAIAVASCESGLDRHGRLDGNWATNGNNYGLFQINGVHADKWPDFYQDWMNPEKNIEWAFEIWSKSGWAPWECKPVLRSGLTDWVYHGATVAPESPTDTPPPVASPTPTPTETPPAVVSASPTDSPPSSSSPTPTATPQEVGEDLESGG